MSSQHTATIPMDEYHQLMSLKIQAESPVRLAVGRMARRVEGIVELLEDPNIRKYGIDWAFVSQELKSIAAEVKKTDWLKEARGE